jgi:hypothetical protein
MREKCVGMRGTGRKARRCRYSRWGLREGQGFPVLILEKRCREEDEGRRRGAFMRGRR